MRFRRKLSNSDFILPKAARLESLMIVIDKTEDRKLAVLLIWKGQLQNGTNSVKILHGCQEIHH